MTEGLRRCSRRSDVLNRQSQPVADIVNVDFEVVRQLASKDLLFVPRRLRGSELRGRVEN